MTTQPTFEELRERAKLALFAATLPSNEAVYRLITDESADDFIKELITQAADTMKERMILALPEVPSQETGYLDNYAQGRWQGIVESRKALSDVSSSV